MIEAGNGNQTRDAPPNKSLQRSVNHKVLGRGRGVSALWRVLRARVLTSQPAAAELNRWATDRGTNVYD
jgi:hypothetical protein